MCLFSAKWVRKQVLNDHNLLCSLQSHITNYSVLINLLYTLCILLQNIKFT
jgi:hypothetical protein